MIRLQEIWSSSQENRNKKIQFFTQSTQRKLRAKHAKKKLMTENEISHIIIGAAIELHKTIGAGLLESAYENALAFDLKQL